MASVVDVDARTKVAGAAWAFSLRDRLWLAVVFVVLSAWAWTVGAYAPEWSGIFGRALGLFFSAMATTFLIGVLQALPKRAKAGAT